MNVHMVYITTSDKKEARQIGRTLIDEKLVACVNIFDGINSMYQWNGELQDDTEAVLVAKTHPSRIPELIERVKALHSYECPCIVSLPISAGNPEFLAWVAREVNA
ncbi:MAG: divalent-cation tolerance protein CutA [Desulfobacteraceae bacterium]|nr:divalent-cation tolerance protein CutA [Desulfobacteraceae bacterium]